MVVCFVCFCKFCKLCIFIVMFMYCYCYVCSVLYILFSLCCSVYCLYVNVYCTTATGCQPIAVNKYIISYHFISSYRIIYHIIPYLIISYFETSKTVQPRTQSNIPEDLKSSQIRRIRSECQKYIFCISTIRRSGDRDSFTVLPFKMDVHK